MELSDMLLVGIEVSVAFASVAGPLGASSEPYLTEDLLSDLLENGA